MKPAREVAALQSRLGYQFKDTELLVRALTHPSVASATRRSNQRLEFLGDRVLNLIVAEALLADDRDSDEGTIAPRYNQLVRKETCAALAGEIDLGAALRLSPGEMKTGGRRRMATLADALEAVVAAIYVDGGYAAAKKVVTRLYGARISDVAMDAKDAKTRLQEWAQGNGLALPEYIEIARSGPDHALVFTIEARVASGQTARAEAPSKRAAEQAAAEALLAEVARDG
ncbi:MAG: ribonuclease III [Pseudomonadota bacterium]